MLGSFPTAASALRLAANEWQVAWPVTALPRFSGLKHRGAERANETLSQVNGYNSTRRIVGLEVAMWGAFSGVKYS